MQTINIAPVSVDPTTPTNLLTTDQINALQQFGISWVIVNPSVDIVLVGGGLSGFPGVQAGSTTNSPVTCPAGTATAIAHRSGPLLALSTSGTATVKISLENQV